VNKLDLSLYHICPIELQLLNGSLGSQITHAVDLRICHCTGDIFVVTFLVTQLDPPVVLVFGYTWFYCYNLLIDWYKGQILSFQTPLQVLKPTPIGPQLPELQPTDSEPIQPQSTPTGLLLSEPWPTNSVPPRPESPLSSPATPEVLKVEQPKPSVSFINAAAYARAACMEGSVSFQLSLSDPSLWGQSASTAPAEPDMSSIPEEYHKYTDVFSKERADTLSEHCPYNLKIDLEEGAEPPLGRMYFLSQTEVQALHEFLDENLRIRFICSSKVGHSMPILFVKKKDGSLCCGLNCLMKKDHYPLLLISDLLDGPGKARIYTKIDLRHTYHLV